MFCWLFMGTITYTGILLLLYVSTHMTSGFQLLLNIVLFEVFVLFSDSNYWSSARGLVVHYPCSVKKTCNLSSLLSMIYS